MAETTKQSGDTERQERCPQCGSTDSTIIGYRCDFRLSGNMKHSWHSPVSEVKPPAALSSLQRSCSKCHAWLVPGESQCPCCGTAQPPAAALVQEVHLRSDAPSCHVCGIQMVPTGWKCLSCGASTEPMPAAAGSTPKYRVVHNDSKCCTELFVDGVLTGEIGDGAPKELYVEWYGRIFGSAEARAPETAEQPDQGCSMSGDPWRQHGKDGYCVVRGEQCPPACMIKRMAGLERDLAYAAERVAALSKELNNVQLALNQSEWEIKNWMSRAEKAESDLAEARREIERLKKSLAEIIGEEDLALRMSPEIGYCLSQGASKRARAALRGVSEEETKK